MAKILKTKAELEAMINKQLQDEADWSVICDPPKGGPVWTDCCRRATEIALGLAKDHSLDQSN